MPNHSPNTTGGGNRRTWMEAVAYPTTSTPHHRNGPFTRTDLEVRTWGLAVYDASDAEAQHCLL